MKLRFVAMTGVMSLAGLGLVGAGAHAVFSTSTTSNQTISTGIPAVTLSGTCLNGPCAGNPNSLYALSNNGATLTFTPGGPYGSTYTTGDEEVTATNTGNLPLTEITMTLNVTYPTSPLVTESYVCIGSTGLGTGGSWFQIYNGPLGALVGTGGSYGWGQDGDTLTVANTPYITPPGPIPAVPSSGPTDNYIVNIYAGPGVSTACGTSTAPPLNSDAENESVVASVTMTYQG
jgi:hypothetical protein